MVAKWALKALWNFCSNDRDLLRNVVDTRWGHWVGKYGGLDAGLNYHEGHLLKLFSLKKKTYECLVLSL